MQEERATFQELKEYSAELGRDEMPSGQGGPPTCQW